MIILKQQLLNISDNAYPHNSVRDGVSNFASPPIDQQAIFILLWHWLYHVSNEITYLWFCWSLNLQKLVWWNLFFWILVPLGGGGGHACMGMVCYHCIVHLPSSSKKTLFCLSVTATCAELCCQTTWGHIPLVCAKLEP